MISDTGILILFSVFTFRHPLALSLSICSLLAPLETHLMFFTEGAQKRHDVHSVRTFH